MPVTLFYLEETFPTVDYAVVHLLDDDNILGGNDDGPEGATLCGAITYEDDAGFVGSDAEIVPGHPVCPACVRVALELEQQSIYAESPHWQPFIWNEASASWEVGEKASSSHGL